MEGVTIDDARSEDHLEPTQLHEADLKNDLLLLDRLLGDTRVRYRQRKTKFASSEQLIDVDLEICDALKRPLSPQLQLDVRRLTARLRALDPH
jgi:hypothetical protein